MSRRLGVLDVSYLCHRARYTTGALSHGGVRTGVLFGFLRDVRGLKDELELDDFVFAFDGGCQHRKNLDETYKANREEGNLTPEEKMELADFHSQVKQLREGLLQKIGFKNIFWEPGYEGDDIIARVCIDQSRAGNFCTIVSADHDLFQCLNDRVSIYNPTSKKRMDCVAFVAEYGVAPSVWPTVKAIAGCSSDNVAGVAGVGEKTAIKYIKNELKPALKKYRDIERNGAQISKNLRLVKLPISGTPSFDVQQDAVTERGWNEVEAALGIRPQRAKPVSGGFF